VNGQLTPNQVVNHLAALSRQLDEVTEELNRADEEATELRGYATVANSEAFLRAEGAMDLRKHKAIVATHELRFAAELAEQKVRGLTRSQKTLMARIEVGRSTGAAVRSDISLAGSGVHGA
jgi:chaperonin cofactor prefoldin